MSSPASSNQPETTLTGYKDDLSVPPLPLARRLKWLTTTRFLIAANFLVFLAMLACSIYISGLQKFMNDPLITSFDSGILFSWGADNGLLTLSGQYWRLITSLFLHSNIVHLSGNMLFLWAFGGWLDRIFGNTKALIIYLLTGTASSLLSTSWDTTKLSDGASGAIYGQAGVLIALLAFAGLDLFRGHKRGIIIALLFLTPIEVTFGHLSKRIDYAAHIGGLVSGLLLGGILAWTFRTPHTQREARQYRSLAFAAIALLLLLIVSIQLHSKMIGLYREERALWKEQPVDVLALMAVRARREIAQDPNNPQAHADLAQAYKFQLNREEAAAEYRRALEIEPGNHSFQYELADTYFSQGRFRDAAPLFQQSLSQGHPTSSQYQKFAITLIATRRFQEAEEVARKFVALDSKSSNSHQLLAQILLLTGKEAEAERERKLAEQLPPSK